MEFTNKVFFITGGAQGLGKLYTEAVLEKGSKVFFGDVNAVEGEKTLTEFANKHGADRVRFKAFDVTDKAAFEAAFKQAVSDFGSIDVMVNNAGVMNEGIWELMIQINVTALVHGTRLATDHMRKDKGGKGGRIINISSIAGMIDHPSLPVYCATKHAVRSYTSSMAGQPNIAAQGIHYALLCPHAANTDLILKLDDSKLQMPQIFLEQIQKAGMPPEKVVEGFLRLLAVENLNGTILLAEKDGTHFKEMSMSDAADPDEASEEK